MRSPSQCCHLQGSEPQNSSTARPSASPPLPGRSWSQRPPPGTASTSGSSFLLQAGPTPRGDKAGPPPVELQVLTGIDSTVAAGLPAVLGGSASFSREPSRQAWGGWITPGKPCLCWPPGRNWLLPNPRDREGYQGPLTSASLELFISLLLQKRSRQALKNVHSPWEEPQRQDKGGGTQLDPHGGKWWPVSGGYQGEKKAETREPLA